MAFSDFGFEEVLTKFKLTHATAVLFPTVSRTPPPSWLTASLARITPAMRANEKSRSECLIAPILTAVREVSGDKLAVFSGARFDVDPANGLNGECDFLLTLSPPVYPIRAPVVAMAEAKKADLDLGMGQCVSEMLAAQAFNRAEQSRDGPMFGCVTNGDQWQFLRLDGTRLVSDWKPYSSAVLDELLGAFLAVMREFEAPSA